MAYISQVNLPGSETPFDIADKTIGISSEVTDGNWQFNLIRNGEGLPDVTNVQKKVTNVDVTLTASAWSNSQQTVTVAGLGVNDTVWVSIASSATAEQREAAGSAQIAGTGQAANALTFTCYGTTPTINIPVALTIAPA